MLWKDGYWLMLPDFFRHNYLREFDDGDAIPCRNATHRVRVTKEHGNTQLNKNEQ